MKERLEEPRTEPVFPDLPPEPPEEGLAHESAAPEVTALGGTNFNWLRLAYAFEFLLALLAILTVWSEVGGQGHLDMMPWYTKLACLIASAWCAVRFTAGLVEESKAWNRRTRLWLSGLVLIALAMGAITFYYHLHEEQDQPDSDETTATAMMQEFPLLLSKA